MSDARPDRARGLREYLTQVRRRALLLIASESLLVGVGLGLLCLVGLAAMTDTVVTPLRARLTTGLVLLGPALALVYIVVRARQLRGLGVTRMLASAGGSLSDRLRGALELAEQAPAGVSTELLEAHIERVALDAEAHPAEEVVPLKRLKSPRALLALGIGLACLVALTQLPSLRRGLAALGAPAQQRDDGTLVANVLRSADVRLLYPSYMQREPVLLHQPSHVEAPAGTTAEITVVPRIPVEGASLLTPSGSIRMAGRNGVFSGRMVIRKSGELRVQLRALGERYEHAKAIAVEATADRVPVVEVNRPNDNASVEVGEPVEVAFHAQDDEGLMAIDLVVQTPSGGEVRNRIWTPDGNDGVIDVLESSALLLPQAAGVYPGDSFDVWIEAHDGDAVSGPNIGRSSPITLFALSDAQQLSEQLPQLKAVLDMGTVTLADHLEAGLESDDARLAGLGPRAKASATFAEALMDFVDGLTAESERNRFQVEQLTAMAGRVDRKQQRMRAAAARGSYRGALRDRLHGEMVTELEGDVLFLADLLAQAHVQEAQALASELQELRKRMQSLLSNLSQEDSELAKQELLAELNRAEARLRELMRSMAQLASHVPSEFVNEEAVPRSGAGSTMEDLRASLQEGDMEAAARHLEELERELSSLTESLNEGGLRFREARYGPRDQALEEARERLGMLKEAQRKLAQDSSDKTRQIMGRGGSQEFDQNAMDKLADRVEQQLQQLDPGVMGMGDRELHDQARQRVRDARDALRAGDLSEAARMAAAGQRTVDRLARDLETDARMFPGHDGKTGENAESAQRAAKGMEQLREQVEGALPRLSDQMNRDDLNALQNQAGAQEQARRAAKDLREKFEHGPDGMPLSPEASRTLEDVEQTMRRAERELRRGDPQAAALSQEQAAEELEELQDDLAKQQEMAQQQAGGQRGGRDGNSSSGGGKVDIPDDKDFEAPAELRRRLLDAMREGSPAGYEAAVQRYFKELMQ